MVTVYSGQAAAASGKRTSLLPVNRESGAALASGFLGEYPIHPASAGRAEGHREGCAPACSYGRRPGSLSAPPEMPHRPRPAGPLPVRGCGGRAGGELALLWWPPPLLTARSSSAVRTHLPIAPWSWAGQGDHPPGAVLPSPPTLPSKGAWLPPLSAVSRVLGAEGGPPGSRAQKRPPAAPGLKWQSLLLVRSARTPRSL